MIIVTIDITTGKHRSITHKVALIKDTHCFIVNSSPTFESKVTFAIKANSMVEKLQKAKTLDVIKFTLSPLYFIICTFLFPSSLRSL